MKTTIIRVAIYTVLAWLTLCPATARRASSQRELNQQAEQAFQAEDAALNKVYKELLNKIDKQSQAKLRAAQSAWVQFRDADADLEADLAARGGTMAPLIISTRSTELTKTRRRELQRLLKDYVD